MAVTIKQQPEAYTPVYNEQVFVALSTQTAQPHFEYTVKVTDLISLETKTYPVPKRPDNYLVFDAREFAQSYFEADHHYIPMNVYGWKQATGIRKVRVNIGETYGTTPLYTAGSNIDYIVWNGIEGYREFPTYDPDNYVHSAATSNLVYLTKSFDEYTFPDRSNYLYALTSGAGDIKELRITTYDSAGTIIANSVIPNPFEALTTYSLKYLCIDIGHKGLTNISSGAVTGTYPIITASVASYQVNMAYMTGSPPAYSIGDIRHFTIGCEPRFDVYTVHFLAQSGCFETVHFSKRSEIEYQTTKTTFKRDPHVFDAVAETYSYSASTPQEYALSVLEKQVLKLSTDWLSQDQADAYRHITKSAFVYLDTGSANDYIALKVATSSIRPRIVQNEKLYQLIIDFELANFDGAQV